jgi:hypothetical protein
MIASLLPDVSVSSVSRKRRRRRTGRRRGAVSIAPTPAFPLRDLIFPDFLRDEERYALAQRYWAVIFDRAKAESFVEVDPEHASWQNHWYVNPLRDGDAIFTAISRKRGLAVCINQLTVTPTNLRHVTYTAGESERSTQKGLRELVITCVPARKTMPAVVSLLTCWLRGEITPQEFVSAYDYDPD